MVPCRAKEKTLVGRCCNGSVGLVQQCRRKPVTMSSAMSLGDPQRRFLLARLEDNYILPSDEVSWIAEVIPFPTFDELS